MERYFAFENLTVWKDAIAFASKVYDVSGSFPGAELYGMISQIRRASTSISLNIAEGKGRSSSKDFVRFLYQSRGSLYEVVTCLKLALVRNWINTQDYENLYQEAMNLQLRLSRLISSMQ